MFCGNCGKKIEDNAKFCPYCGSKVSAMPKDSAELIVGEKTLYDKPDKRREKSESSKKRMKEKEVIKLDVSEKLSQVNTTKKTRNRWKYIGRICLIITGCWAIVLILVLSGGMASKMRIDTKTSALTILNWPYTGQGKITIYIRGQPEEKGSISFPGGPVIPAFTGKLFTQSHVARHFSISLDSPFKLESKDGGDWTDSGIYDIQMFIPDDNISSIEKKAVIFSNGAATIDFNSMIVNQKTQEEKEALDKLLEKLQKSQQ